MSAAANGSPGTDALDLLTAAGEVYARLRSLSDIAERVGQEIDSDSGVCNAVWAAIFLLRDTTKAAGEASEALGRYFIRMGGGES